MITYHYKIFNTRFPYFSIFFQFLTVALLLQNDMHQIMVNILALGKRKDPLSVPMPQIKNMHKKQAPDIRCLFFTYVETY